MSFFHPCKESDSETACVHPYLCLSHCKDSQLCNKDHKCQAAHVCKVDKDCQYGEQCKDNSLGRRICLLPNVSTSTSELTFQIKDECGNSLDCQLIHLNKPVCKDEDGAKTCVESDKCKCGESEVCSSDEKCIPTKECESSEDCDDTKVCRSFISGRKTCVGYTIEEQSLPCFTNKGCQGKGNAKTVCKESHGKRTCVYPEKCLSSCFSDLGFCNSKHRCKLTCTTAWDCKVEEVCKSTGTQLEKTCQSETTSVNLLESCENNLDCKKVGEKNTVCKAAKLEKSKQPKTKHFNKYLFSSVLC